MQLCVNRLSEMMSKPRKFGDLRLASTSWTQKLSLRHQEYRDIVRISVNFSCAGGEEKFSIRAGLGFHGGHLIDSWVAPDQVRALSLREAEFHGIVDGQHEGSSRSTCTRGPAEPSTSRSRRFPRQGSGCVPEPKGQTALCRYLIPLLSCVLLVVRFLRRFLVRASHIRRIFVNVIGITRTHLICTVLGLGWECAILLLLV